MKFFLVKATSRPQNPLPFKVKISKTVAENDQKARDYAFGRSFKDWAKVTHWWELQHSQTILCKMMDGTILELQSMEF